MAAAICLGGCLPGGDCGDSSNDPPEMRIHLIGIGPEAPKQMLIQADGYADSIRLDTISRSGRTQLWFALNSAYRWTPGTYWLLSDSSRFRVALKMDSTTTVDCVPDSRATRADSATIWFGSHAFRCAVEDQAIEYACD